MMKKRLLGILLSLALMMTMMSALAFAQDEPDAENTETKNVAAEEVPVSGEVQYPLWIGETQVTSEKLSGKGWSYDVASHTLTLDNFSYNGAGHQWAEDGSDYFAAIYAENDLTVQVKGANTIKNDPHTEWVYGIYAKKALTVDGDGKLTFPESGIDYSIATIDGDLIVDNATINTHGKYYGFHVLNGDFCINGGNITAEDSSRINVGVNGNLEISDATVSISGKTDNIVVDGNVIINSGVVTSASENGNGICAFGKLEINGGFVRTSSLTGNSISVLNLEMNSGRMEAVCADNRNGIYVDNGDAVINGGTVIASGRNGIYTNRRIYFNGGDVTASGTNKGVRADRKVFLSDKATVKAGDNEASAVDVTSTFAKEHDQKWVHVVVTPDPEPAPIDPTAVGTLHEVPSSVGVYVVTAADAVSLAKAPSKKSYTLPATVTINGKVFNVTGINAKAFKGTKVRTLTVKTKGLTKASVKGSLKGSKVRTVKVKVGKKKENKKFVKKYKKIFTKKNAGKKVSVRR